MSTEHNTIREAAEKAAENLHEWMSDQKMGREDILHAAVVCDFAGSVHFKQALARQIQRDMHALAVKVAKTAEEAVCDCDCQIDPRQEEHSLHCAVSGLEEALHAAGLPMGDVNS